MLRFTIRFIWLLGFTWISVLVRRLFRGAKHPAWNFKTEYIASFLHVQFAELLHLAPAVLNRKAPAALVPKAIQKTLRFQTDQLGERSAEVHIPNGWTPADGTLLYLHGGGYGLCSPATHRELISRIAFSSRMRAVAVDYRLAPDHPFPAALEDTLAAYQHLLDTGCSPSKICIGGDSAGGGLTLATLLSLRDAGRPLPKAAVLLSPWVDLTCRGESIDGHAPFDYLSREGLEGLAKQYAATEELKHPMISPLFADLQGLPPMLVQTGGAEAFYSENVQFVEAAQNAGCDVTFEVSKGMVHVWQAFARFLPEGKSAITSLGFFLRQHMTRKGSETSPPA